jgi:hypothetical protein
MGGSIVSANENSPGLGWVANPEPEQQVCLLTFRQALTYSSMIIELTSCIGLCQTSNRGAIIPSEIPAYSAFHVQASFQQ